MLYLEHLEDVDSQIEDIFKQKDKMIFDHAGVYTNTS